MRSVELSPSPSSEATRLSLSRAVGGAPDADGSTGGTGGGEAASCLGGQAGGGCTGDAALTNPLGGREGGTCDAENGVGKEGGDISGGGKSGGGGGEGGGSDDVGGNDGNGGGGPTVLHAIVPAGHAPPSAAKHARIEPAT